MARNLLIAGAILLTSGCGGSQPLPGPRAGPPDHATDARSPATVGKDKQNSAEPKASSATPKIQSADVKPQAGSTRIDAIGPRAAPVDLNQDKPTFYPVLRNFKDGDFFTQKVVYIQVAPGLGVFACRRINSPDGRTRIDYVMKNQLAGYGLDTSKLIELCYENFFKAKIEVKTLEQGDDVMLSFSSAGRLVAAIVGHSSTLENLSKMLDSESIAILIDSPDILLATIPGNSFETKFYEIAKKSRHKNDALNLDPAVYHWTKRDGLKAVSQARETRN